MRIGHHQLTNCLIAAPMAGITDRPFRTLCHAMGAGMAVSEMLSSNPEVWRTDKSRLRMVHSDEPGIRSVQIAGCDPDDMAAAARINVASGAQIIDINMGCPAKKVNRKLAGSALLQYPDLVKRILHAVVDAVDVPVTLKIRTGWAPEHRNCVEIAQLAEDCGIQALTIHGRTRACLFNGNAEYDSIRAVKQSVSIPIIANGDITDPHKARAVLGLYWERANAQGALSSMVSGAVCYTLLASFNLQPAGLHPIVPSLLFSLLAFYLGNVVGEKRRAASSLPS